MFDLIRYFIICLRDWLLASSSYKTSSVYIHSLSVTRDIFAWLSTYGAQSKAPPGDDTATTLETERMHLGSFNSDEALGDLGAGIGIGVTAAPTAAAASVTAAAAPGGGTGSGASGMTATDVVVEW